MWFNNNLNVSFVIILKYTLIDWCISLKCLFPKCIYPKCIFAKCTQLVCLPSKLYEFIVQFRVYSNDSFAILFEANKHSDYLAWCSFLLCRLRLSLVLKHKLYTWYLNYHYGCVGCAFLVIFCTWMFSHNCYKGWKLLPDD